MNYYKFKEKGKKGRQAFMNECINDLQLLNEIRESCYQGNDIRASWIGPNLPATDVDEFKAFAIWALEHLRMYQGFYYNIPKEKSYTILDIACGTGYNTNILSSVFKNSKIIGIDFDEICIKFAKQYNKNSGVIFLCDNILSYINSNSFDFIFCLETLEHILAEDHHTAIRSLLNNLNPTGTLFLTTPNEDTPDESTDHIGFLNKERAKQFKKTFESNIVSISYYDNTSLINKNPQAYITDDKNASHYKIEMRK